MAITKERWLGDLRHALLVQNHAVAVSLARHARVAGAVPGEIARLLREARRVRIENAEHYAKLGIYICVPGFEVMLKHVARAYRRELVPSWVAPIRQCQEVA